MRTSPWGRLPLCDAVCGSVFARKGECKRECARAHKPVREKERKRETERLIDRELKGEREKG